MEVPRLYRRPRALVPLCGTTIVTESGYSSTPQLAGCSLAIRSVDCSCLVLSILKVSYSIAAWLSDPLFKELID